MRVYIGPYIYRWVSNVHTRHMERKYGVVDWGKNQDWKDRAWERFEDFLQWVYNHTINLYLDNKERKVNVRIDDYDVWNMDDTLSHIILPMLHKLKEDKHGAPFVDDEDVPEELKSTSAPPKKNEYDLDDNHFKRWDWVLDEMIWSFEQKKHDWWEEQYYKYEDDPDALLGLRLVWSDDEGRKKHQERMTNGFRLFGRYYECLWD